MDNGESGGGRPLPPPGAWARPGGAATQLEEALPAPAGAPSAEARVASALGRLHRRSRTWPVPGQVAWWVLLLPLAVVAWAGTLASTAVRRSVWGVTVLAVAASGLTKPDSSPDRAETVAVPTATTAPLPPVTSAAVTTSAPQTTVRPSTSVAAVADSSTSVPAPTTVPGARTASDVLAIITVAKEHADGYARDQFPTWLAVDATGCDARVLVLIRESTVALAAGSGSCSAAGGRWVSPYDGEAITDPGNAQIDHLVSVKEAWDSGAWAWTPEQRAAYANDITDVRTLHAVTPAANTSKGDRDPSNWMPSRPEYRCTYVAEWLAVKVRWGLTMDESEAGRIRNVLKKDCAGLIVAPWTAAPSSLPTATTSSTTPVAVTEPPATEPPATTAASVQGIFTPPAATAPAPTEPPATDPPATEPPVPTGDITPGAWCPDLGATAIHNGLTYVCDVQNSSGSSYKDGRGHWRRR